MERCKPVLCESAPLLESWWGFGSLLFLKDRRPPIAGLQALFLSVLICFSFLSGCRETDKPAPDLVVEHEITPQPPRVGPATITLRLFGADGAPYKDAEIRLEGNMSHAGMRPIFSEARRAGPGRYEAPVEFTMAGDWIILVHITLPQGQKVQRQFAIKGVQSE
jgi:hypothetical protein